MDETNSYLNICSFLSLGTNVLPHDSSEELASSLMSCFDKAMNVDLFTKFNTCNFEKLTRKLFSCLKCETCSQKVAVGLLNRGRLECILETNEVIWQFYCTSQVLTTTTASEQLFVSLALAVICLILKVDEVNTDVFEVSDIMLLSVEMFAVIGKFLASLKVPELSSKTPRRALVGHATLNTVKFDVVIERDNTNRVDGSKGAWSTPGFRLLFTQDRNTIAYILIEVILPSETNALEWSLRGMHVNSDMRGQGFSKMVLSVWLLLSHKMGAISSTRRINKPLISLALLQVGFEPSNTSTAVSVELANSEPISKKRSREEEVAVFDQDTIEEKDTSNEAKPLSKNEIKRRLKAKKLAHKKQKKCKDEVSSVAPIRLWCERRERVLSILSKSEMFKLGIELLVERPLVSRSVYVNAAYHLKRPPLSSSAITSSSEPLSNEEQPIHFMLYAVKLLFVAHPSRFTE